jgi:hypothetical protein
MPQRSTATSVLAPNMALQRTRCPRIPSGRSLRSLGSPLSFWSLGAAYRVLTEDI